MVATEREEFCVERKKEELQVNPILGHPRRLTDKSIANGIAGVNGGPIIASNLSHIPSQSTEGQLSSIATPPLTTKDANQATTDVKLSDNDSSSAAQPGSYNNVLIKNIKVENNDFLRLINYHHHQRSFASFSDEPTYG